MVNRKESIKRGLDVRDMSRYRRLVDDIHDGQAGTGGGVVERDDRPVALLGGVVGHTLGFDLSWVVRGGRGDDGSLTFQVGYDLMHYRYLMLDESPTIGHMLSLDIALAK